MKYCCTLEKSMNPRGIPLHFTIPHIFVTNIHPPAETKRPSHEVTPGAGAPMDINKLKCDIKCFMLWV